jgi:hypothetical protein
MQTLLALIAASLLQPACATSPMTSTCTVTGSLAALPGMDAPALCQRFESALAAALGRTGTPEGLVIALTLHKRGAIDARLTRTGEDGDQSLPVISVDALDRALQPDDIDRLARASAQALGEPVAETSARPIAHLKGN